MTSKFIFTLKYTVILLAAIMLISIISGFFSTKKSDDCDWNKGPIFEECLIKTYLNNDFERINKYFIRNEFEKLPYNKDKIHIFRKSINFLAPYTVIIYVKIDNYRIVKHIAKE